MEVSTEGKAKLTMVGEAQDGNQKHGVPHPDFCALHKQAKNELWKCATWFVGK